jgi:hypothetical protein
LEILHPGSTPNCGVKRSATPPRLTPSFTL